MSSHSLTEKKYFGSDKILLKDYLRIKRIGLFGISQYVIISSLSFFFFQEFTLFDNWLSELGNKYLESGELNILPRILWILTTYCLAICLFIYFSKIPKRTRLTKNVSWLILISIPFLAISGVVPRDSQRLIHDRSIAVFYISSSLSVLIFSIALVKRKEWQIIGYIGIISSLFATFYMIGALLPFSQSPFRKIAQKILCLIYQFWYGLFIYYDPLNATVEFRNQKTC